MSNRLAAGLIALLVLVACTPRDMLVSGGGAAGSAAMQERGIGGAVTDYQLRLAINDAWFQESIELYERASLLILRGRVIIVGRVPTQDMKERAEQLAIKAGAVKPLNRLTVGPDLPVGTRFADESITVRLGASLTFDRDVKSLNYALETKDGTVYLIGETVSARERQRVIWLAEHLSGVRAVEAYIEVLESSL